MNTQNLDYNEIAKENQIVANALSARDDEQQEVMAIDEQREELQVKLDELQQVKAKAKEKLANADDKLFALATMAQDSKEQIEALKAEHEKELAEISGTVESLQEDHKRIVDGSGFLLADIEAYHATHANDDPGREEIGEFVETLKRLTRPAPYKEVQEELELAS
jgi:chromosome segregation ATPase